MLDRRVISSISTNFNRYKPHIPGALHKEREVSGCIGPPVSRCLKRLGTQMLAACLIHTSFPHAICDMETTPVRGSWEPFSEASLRLCSRYMRSEHWSQKSARSICPRRVGHFWLRRRSPRPGFALVSNRTNFYFAFVEGDSVAAYDWFRMR